MNRELLMLAKVYKDQDVGRWYMSRKLDGQRCFWDGGVSRGVYTYKVPWANTDKNVRPTATGLWSRYGNVIEAPEWFLDGLPIGIPLDGELFLRDNALEETRSIVSRHVPDERWREIKYVVFDSPTYEEFGVTGTINNPNFKTTIRSLKVMEFINDSNMPMEHRSPSMFHYTLDYLKELFDSGDLGSHVQLLEQEQLAPFVGGRVVEKMIEVTEAGGEGLMLRHPYSFWVPKRVNQLLKVKPMQDDEAVVIGYTAGLGKYKGMLGALIVRWGDVEFELSGMTDEERQLLPEAERWAKSNPGASLPDPWSMSEYFPIGSRITFKYTGALTNGGKPKEARYWRHA